MIGRNTTTDADAMHERNIDAQSAFVVPASPVHREAAADERGEQLAPTRRLVVRRTAPIAESDGLDSHPRCESACERQAANNHANNHISKQ